MRGVYRRNNAATTIVAVFRGSKQKKVFRTFRRAIVLLQAEQRRKLAIARVRKIRDPYCDMTFKECKSLLKTEQSSLEKAVAEKDFRLAATLEAKM